MAIRISLFSKWLLVLVVFQLICTIGLSVGSEDDDLGISSSKLEGSSEDLKSDFSFESERQSPASSPNSKLKTSEELKLEKNGNLLENDEYIVQDDESEDDGYIVQDNESEDGYVVQDDESDGDGYIAQDDKNDLPKLQSKISSKSTSNVHTPDNDGAQSIKPSDDSNDIPTGRKDVYHYGNASPKAQSSGKHPEASSSLDDGKTSGDEAIQPPKKSKLSTWEKAQLMMMKRNKNKIEKETQQKGDEIVVGSPFISLDAKASSLVSEKSLDVKHSDSSQRNESSENIDFPQSGKLSSNDVDVGGSAIEESREKFIKQPVSVEQDESAIASDSSDGDIDNNLKSRKDVDKDVSRHDRESERSDSKVSPTGESHLSKNIKSGKDEGDGTIDQEGSDGISEDDIDASQSSDEDQDKDDAGGQESDTNLENVKEVKNEVHAAENRGSLDSKVLSSSKDDFKDEVANSSNSEEGSTHNLMNKSISDVKGVSPKPTTYVEKGAVEKVNITSDVLTRDELKVDLEHIYPDDANDTDGNQSDSTKDIDRIETDGHDDKNENKYKGDTESETVGRDAVSTAGNVASFGKDTLDRQMESLDGHSVKDQTNLVVKDLENVEDEQDVLIKEDSEKDSEEINKDSQSSDSALANNNSELSKDIYDNNDIKQVNESGAKEGPVKDEIKKDDGEGTQMSKPPIRDVSDDSDSDKSDGKEMDEDTKDIETKKDNKDNVEIDDEKPMDGKDSQSSDSPLVNNNSELSKDIYDDNDIKQVNESGAKEGPVKDEIKKDDGEGTQMSKPPIRDVSDDSGSDKSDDKEMDEDTKDIETKKNYMDNVEIDDEKPKDGKDSEEDTENDGDVEAREDTVERTDERQANNSVDQKEYKSHGKKMDEGTKNIESKENATDIGDDEGSEDDDTADDEDVEAGEDAVEGTDKQQADNYIEKGDDMNVDDGHVDNDAKKVEDNDENESEDIDSENVVLEIDAKLSDDLIDGSEQNINDDKNIDKVYRNAHKEGEVRDNVAKDGDGKTSYTNADGNAENMEATRDKNNIEEENKQVVDKLSNNEDENISGNNKSPKKDDENVNRFDEEQIGDKKGHKDAEINSENVDVSLDSKDDESGNETLDEPSKDDDEISDVDDFEGSKKDDNSIAKNDQYKDVTKDDNNNDVNEKDSKTSVGSVVDTNKIVNKTSSNHTTARNATFFEEINSKKMQKDDSFEEDITDNKTQVYQDDQTSTGARESEGKRLNKDVIDGGDAPGLIFEDVPTYVEITRDHDERGTDANINDGTINVDVDGGSDGPIAFDPTPAPSLEAAPSNKDATADSETSVKDMDSEKLDVSVAKNVVDSLKEMSDFESSISQEADKESAKNEDISNIIAEVDKDISNDIETTETSNLEHEEVMSDSTVNTNEYEVHTNTADERKAISTPDARGQVGKVGSYESEKESFIESDEKNLDDIPQEPDVSTGQLFPSEHVKAKDESQSVEDDSNFSDIPSRIDNPKVTSDVEDGKMTENERVVDNENADDHKKLTGASEEMTEAKDDGKIAEDEDVKADGKMVEVLDVKVDEKMVEDLDVKVDEKMVEDLDVKDDGKMVEDLDVKDDGKMVEDLDVKVDEGNVEKDVEKYFQDTTLQSTRKNWVFFTIKPYISLLKTVMKKLDPFITGIIFMLPPSMQNIFLKAPFNMYPTHAFLLFTLSCLSLFVISFSKIFKGNKQHSKSKELKEMLFETKGVLLLSQVERDEAEKKLQDLKAKLKQKDDDLESGTVEMNKNLKALIKECDALKEEVSRRMESSKEMKRDMKKAESDIQKQLLANKELQESITSAKSHVQQLQDKRDQLQSSVDESELNSMKLEEKIQCLSEDVEAVEESYDQLRTEVESKLKESGELQTTVDLLKERCSKKSGDIETKEKENKILREAIVQLKIMKHLQEEDKNDDDDDGCDDDKKKEKLEERIKHLIYIAQMRSSMDEIEEEKESLKKSLTGAAEKKMDLNDELKRTMEEIEKVEQLREDAERQATASTMKIDVLSDYYKQREKEYNKMLQEKEAKEKAISSQKKSANERYREVDKMVADYKNQVEVLTQELERIGIHYEKQMALQENKLQENLVFVKQTERDYNIKVKEAEIMRQKLLQYRERINLLESMMASHKSTETLNTSQTKEDIRPASRNLLLRENMPSPPNFMPPSFSPHPSSLGPIPPQFFNPPPFMMRHPFIPPRLPMRSREDSPTLQRIRESDDFLDERDHYPTSRARSPLRFGPSPACRNRSSPVELKDKYTPLANNRPLDPFYMEKGDGSHRTKYSDK